MRSSVILFVDTVQRAETLQRGHDPQHLRVMPIGAHSGARAHSIIVEVPVVMTGAQRERFDHWCSACAPLYVAGGDGSRIVYI